MVDSLHSIRAQRRPILIAALVLPFILLAACGGGSHGGSVTGPSPTPSPTPPPSFGPVDPAMVGNWKGTVDGSFGPGTFTMSLAADGSIGTAGSGNYCGFAGRWGVTSGEFKASGGDCTGTIVTFTAPVSSTALTGFWTASSGRTGTFTCTKE